MERPSAPAPVAPIAGTTATPWASAFGYWFAFTYLPPASLVGWEARMR